MVPVSLRDAVKIIQQRKRGKEDVTPISTQGGAAIGAVINGRNRSRLTE